ncbi:MAG: hypothetical protein ISR82_03580 [Candidatus Marinimicrobia bacterium]|nr:hypothetical protein [Candidatus Neomarinimicrobiota bacterium]MBL7010285.1 hypothetical protein [Candidatus Neomarinimicrobiota bacterium]MBL7030193.1 hypothetical protein [Candidatus Neomarinimicrobiota bacterium]
MSQLDCEVCKKTKLFTEAKECNECKKVILFENDLDFSECPVCGCNHLYRKKDFNQAIGCIIILIGALLVPWTYGISLIVLSIIDFLLYRRIKDSVECYQCKSEYKNMVVPEELNAFDHHTAELYELGD